MVERAVDPRREADTTAPSPNADPSPQANDLARMARRLLAERTRITRCLDEDLFADPAYEILLDLFASGTEGRPVTMSSSAGVARVPRTTALGWIRLLEQRGLVERYADQGDRRTTLLRLTEFSRSALTSYLLQVATDRASL